MNPRALERKMTNSIATASSTLNMSRVHSNQKKVSWEKLLPALAIIGLVIASYAPALHAGFVWDDDKYVTDNPMLTAPDGLKQIWFSAHTQSQYFPLVYTTFMLEHALWGLNPFGYHLVNILLHSLNAVLLWRVLRRLRVPAAWLAASVFALHPVQVESVAWVSELKNLESLFFCLLATLAWMQVVDAGHFSKESRSQCKEISKPGENHILQSNEPVRAQSGTVSSLRPAGQGRDKVWLCYILSLLAFLFALFAKTTACTLPVALALVVWLRGQRLNLRWVAMVVPFVLLGIGMGLVSVWWEGNLGTYDESLGLSFSLGQRLLLASRALWFYPSKLLWPANLAFSYPSWDLNTANPWHYVPLIACVLLAAGLVLWRNRLGKGVLAAVIFFAATLSPLLGLISNYTFQYSFVADHYQYVASIGLIALGAGGLFNWISKNRSRTSLGWTFCGVLLLLLCWRTSVQCAAYTNSETLWRNTLTKNPESWMAHHNLAMDLQEAGRIDEAMEHYRAAIELNPRHFRAHNNLALALAARGDLSEAIKHYQAALEAKPDFAEGHNNLAVALADRGDYEGAVMHLRRAVELEPKMLGAWLNLGSDLQAQGKKQEALETYRKAVSILPGEEAAWRFLARALLVSGQLDESAAAYRRAIALAPGRADLQAGLAVALASATNNIGPASHPASAGGNF
jgi:tetratricopeptide (TPR) repeat protein